MDNKNNDENNDAENKAQYALYLSDKEQYGDNQSGSHRGFTWTMKRNIDMGHWCGYLDDKLVVTDEIEKKISPHGGLTIYNGFDCAHYEDFVPSSYVLGLLSFGKSIYRDYLYVKKNLEDIIDWFVDNDKI